MLTVLDEAPPADAFRPPYAGGDKLIFRYSDLDTSKLRDLDPPQSRPDFEEFERYLQRPLLDHTTGWLHQLTGPHENQVNYGLEFTRITSMAGLMLNTRATMEEKKDLLIGLTQLGIDLAGVVNAGRQYNADGGHYSGRKFPIVFAGALLGNEKMMRIGESTKFAEDQQTYYGTGWAGQRALYQIVVHTGPKPPHEEIRPENWNQHHKRAESYRRINGMGWPATALVVRVMGLTDAWNHDAFFEYNDRWMSPGAPFAAHAVDRERNKMEGQATAPFVNDMWAQYHDRLPEIDRDGPHRKGVWEDGGQWVENEIPSEAEAKRHAERVAAD